MTTPTNRADLRRVAEELARHVGVGRYDTATLDRIERALLAARATALRQAAALAQRTDEGWGRESYAADEIRALAETEAGHE